MARAFKMECRALLQLEQDHLNSAHAAPFIIVWVDQPKVPRSDWPLFSFTLEQWIWLSYNYTKEVSRFTIIFFSADGKYATATAANSSRYYPQQNVMAFSLKDGAAVEALNHLHVSSRREESRHRELFRILLESSPYPLRDQHIDSSARKQHSHRSFGSSTHGPAFAPKTKADKFQTRIQRRILDRSERRKGSLLLSARQLQSLSEPQAKLSIQMHCANPLVSKVWWVLKHPFTRILTSIIILPLNIFVYLGDPASFSGSKSYGTFVGDVSEVFPSMLNVAFRLYLVSFFKIGLPWTFRA